MERERWGQMESERETREGMTAEVEMGLVHFTPYSQVLSNHSSPVVASENIKSHDQLGGT